MLINYGKDSECDFCGKVGSFNQAFLFSPTHEPDKRDEVAWICRGCLDNQLKEVEEMFK